MAEKGERQHEEKGLSAGVLAVVFLVSVGVCAVFFSLGFLVGYNEQTSKATPPSEHVTALPVVPPTVNPPLRSSDSPAKQPATAASTAIPAARSEREGLGPPSGEAKSSTAESKAPAREPAPRSPAPRPLSPAASTPAPASSAGANQVGMGFAVQVAASGTKADAEKVVEILKARGYPVFLVTPEYAHANDNLYRVQVGPFSSRADAEKVRNKLSQEGFKQPFIRP